MVGLTARRLSLLLAFALAAMPAKAEDFTGFYAGVNAGYGWDREESKGSSPAVASGARSSAAGTASALPPSASAAAAALRRTDRNTAGR